MVRKFARNTGKKADVFFLAFSSFLFSFPPHLHVLALSLKHIFLVILNPFWFLQLDPTNIVSPSPFDLYFLN